MARILVVDDDHQFRLLIRRMLEREGHDIAEAADGAGGLEAFGRTGADLAVIDLYMPDQGGWETLRALRQLEPTLPFLIVSGGAALEGLKRGSPGTLDAARGHAAFRVLRKPVGWHALTNAVDELLSARAAEPS